MATVNEKMAAIADAIRASTGGAEPLTLDGMAQEIPKIYAAGYEEGKAEGGGGESEDFWGLFQNYGARANYSYAFAGSAFKVIKPTYGFENLLNASSLCNGSLMEEIEIYNSKASSWNYAFYNNVNLLKIKGQITPKSTGANLQYMCRSCPLLKEFESLDISQLSATNTMAKEAFSNCPELEEIRFIGTIPCEIKFNYSPKLSHDSLMSIINALADYSNDTSGKTHTITLGSTNLSKLTEEEIQIIRNKGWTYA